jgi:hypothetical protein
MNALMNSNAAKNTNQFLNSLLPMNGSNARGNSSNTGSSGWITTAAVFVGFLLLFAAVFYFFYDQLADMWKTAADAVSGYFNGSSTPPPPPPPKPEEQPPQPAQNGQNGQPPPTPGAPPSSESSSTLEKILPGGRKGVFNVSSNRFTYYDAEPLCKSLGAELATYDQVKEAWSQGADWCNYGWVKGQMAVYPTSDDTYKKMQAGPAEQRNSCGRPGVNGGYFDNPELRYGVNCYGAKPAQSKHDETRMELATPTSPDAVEFDKKVAMFKAEADSLGVLPFNKNRWE